MPECAASNKADLLNMVEISKTVAPLTIDVSLSLPALEVRGEAGSGVSAGKTARQEDYEQLGRSAERDCPEGSAGGHRDLRRVAPLRDHRYQLAVC